MSEITYLKKNENSDSLMTSIPPNVAKEFGLAESDMLKWIIRVEEGMLTIQVKPIKTDMEIMKRADSAF